MKAFISYITLGAVLTGALVFSAIPQAVQAMNKAELIDSIAKEANISNPGSKKALDGFIDTTTKALKKGDRVALVGFGSFIVKKRAETTRSGGDTDGDGYVDVGAASVKFQTQTKGDLTSNDCDDGRGAVPPEHHDADCDDDGLVTLEELKDDMVEEERCLEARCPVDSFFDVFFDIVHDRIGSNEIVSLGKEFGTFYPPTLSGLIDEIREDDEVEFGSRKGRNPQTGKEIKIPAKKAVKFKAGAELSKSVR